MQAEIDPARDDPEGDVRRHPASVDEGNSSRLDRLEAILASRAVRRLAAPSGESRIGFAALFLWAVVQSGGVRLPYLQKSVFQRRSGAVENMALYGDARALHVGAEHRLAEIAGVAVDLDAGMI